jgi:prepilin-type processing-associated H-X9-DG protein
MGLALHNYHSVHGTHPPALLGSGRYNFGACSVAAYQAAQGGVKNTTGWALLAPYFEQGALAGRYNYRVCSSMSSPCNFPVAGNDTMNDGAYNVRIPMLECPSHVDAGQVSSSGAGTTTFYSRRNAIRTSYAFSSGVFTDYSRPWGDLGGDIRRGMFGNDGAARIQDLIDGSSNTLAIGECQGGNSKTLSASGAPFLDAGPWGLTGTHTCCHGRVVANSGPVISYTAAQANDWRINGPWSGGGAWAPTVGKSYPWVFNSYHPGGAQFLFADGSARFLSETMDYGILCRLAFIHDRNPVSGF